MLPKITALALVTLLLLSSSTHATSRPQPNMQTDHPLVPEQEEQVVHVGCEGADEEGCLMRRTLAAHIDYIYTQKDKH